MSCINDLLILLARQGEAVMGHLLVERRVLWGEHNPNSFGIGGARDTDDVIPVALDKLQSRDRLLSVRSLEGLKKRPLALVAGALAPVDGTTAVKIERRDERNPEAESDEWQQKNACLRGHCGLSI